MSSEPTRDAILAETLDVDLDVLRRIREDEREDQRQEMRRMDKQHWKAIIMYQGDEGFRSMYKEKWTAMGLLSALLLTITIPAATEPITDFNSWVTALASALGDSTGVTEEVIDAVIRSCMLLSSIFSLVCILASIFLTDMFNSFCPSPADMVHFINKMNVEKGVSDDPLNFMRKAADTAIIAFLLEFIATTPLFIGVPVACCALGIYLWGFHYRSQHHPRTLIPRNLRKYAALSRNPEGGAEVEVVRAGTGEGGGQELLPEAPAQ